MAEPTESKEPQKPDDFLSRRVEARRAKIARQLDRSRNSKIPTWVYLAFLIAVLAAWITLIVVS